MTSPSRPSRRRQRSTRLLVASALVGLGAVAVVATAVTGAWLAVTLGGVLAVVLAGAAVRITWTEVVVSRREAAHDRAVQAQGYLALTEARTSEQAIHVAMSAGKVARLEATITRLEGRLAAAAAEATEAHRLLLAEQETSRLAGSERDRAVARLDEAEDRAAQAIVRVAELEQELDIMLAEWRSGVHAPQRKHA